MLVLILILSTLNFIGLLIAAFIYFTHNFVICHKEVYEELQTYWLNNHDDEGNEIERELPGGVGVDTGFFREELYEDEGEEEDE